MDAPRIALRAQVTVELLDAAGAAEQMVFTIVPSPQADLRAGLLDEQAPLAQALLGHAAGETVPYVQGDLRAVRILAVEAAPASSPAPSAAAEKRRRTVRQAARQSELTNQMIFATASGSKWGDYDVDLDRLLEDPPPAAEDEEPS